MRVRTVLRVATFFRAPWCSSMLITFFFGWEKLTAKWFRFFVSLPKFLHQYIPSLCLHFVGRRTPGTLNGDKSRLDGDLDYFGGSWSADVPQSWSSFRVPPQKFVSKAIRMNSLGDKCTHHPQGRPMSRLNECTSFWPNGVVVDGGSSNPTSLNLIRDKSSKPQSELEWVTCGTPLSEPTILAQLLSRTSTPLKVLTKLSFFNNGKALFQFKSADFRFLRIPGSRMFA